MKPRSLAAGIAGALLAFSASTASAYVITNTTTSDFTFGFTAPAAGSPYTLTGEGSVDVTAFSATSLTLLVTVTNNTLTSPAAPRPGSDLGISVVAGSTGIVISFNKVDRLGPGHLWLAACA